MNDLIAQHAVTVGKVEFIKGGCEGHHQRIVAVETQTNLLAEELYSNVNAINLNGHFMAGKRGVAQPPGFPCGGGCCGGGSTGAASSWTPSATPSPWSQWQGPGGSGGQGPSAVQESTDGGPCHCKCVTQLIAQVEELGRRRPQQGLGEGPQGSGAPRGQDPWQPGQTQPRAASSPDGTKAKKTLPLPLKGPLGAIGYKERALFDDKIAHHEEYKFNGAKGGINWKQRTERYFISRAPILHDLLKWAEEEDMAEVTLDRFRAADSQTLTEEQILFVNA